MTNQPEDAGRRLATSLGLDSTDIPSVYSELRLAGRDENRNLLLGDQPRLLEVARYSADILRRFQAVDGEIDVPRLPGTTPLASVLREQGK
jgi:hypothetical protein